jgi:hypothetical protein
MSPFRDDYQKRLIRIGLLVAAVFVALSLVAYFLGKGNKQQQTDPDTGEIVYNDHQTPEKQAGGGDIFLLGSAALTDNGATQDQFLKVKDLLVGYGHKTLNNQYDRLAILPDSLTSQDGVLTGQLRLGTTEKRLDLTIKLIALKQVQVIITDPSHRYSDYDSGVVDAAPPTENQDVEFDSGDGTPPDAAP